MKVIAVWAICLFVKDVGARVAPQAWKRSKKVSAGPLQPSRAWRSDKTVESGAWPPKQPPCHTPQRGVQMQRAKRASTAAKARHSPATEPTDRDGT